MPLHVNDSLTGTTLVSPCTHLVRPIASHDTVFRCILLLVTFPGGIRRLGGELLCKPACDRAACGGVNGLRRREWPVKP